MKVAAPLGDFVGPLGKAINDGHAGFLLVQDSGEIRQRPAAMRRRLLTGARRVRQVRRPANFSIRVSP
jgi:hypothetical protein